MASIVYYKSKDGKKVYAYSSESYWDKEKQQPRARRKYLGRVDPDTGEIIEAQRRVKTETRKVLKKNLADIDDEVLKELRNRLQVVEEENASLAQEVKTISEENKRLRKIMTKASALLSSASEGTVL